MPAAEPSSATPPPTGSQANRPVSTHPPSSSTGRRMALQSSRHIHPWSGVILATAPVPPQTRPLEQRHSLESIHPAWPPRAPKTQECRPVLFSPLFPVTGSLSRPVDGILYFSSSFLPPPLPSSSNIVARFRGQEREAAALTLSSRPDPAALLSSPINSDRFFLLFSPLAFFFLSLSFQYMKYSLMPQSYSFVSVGSGWVGSWPDVGVGRSVAVAPARWRHRRGGSTGSRVQWRLSIDLQSVGNDAIGCIGWPLAQWNRLMRDSG